MDTVIAGEAIHCSSFRDAPWGAGPQSIFSKYSCGAMDSGFARYTRAPEWRHQRGLVAPGTMRTASGTR